MSEEEKFDEEIPQEQPEERQTHLLEIIAELGYDNMEDFVRDGATALRGLNEALNEEEKTEEDMIEEIEAEETVVFEIIAEEQIEEVIEMLREEFKHTRPMIVKFGSQRAMIPGMVAEWYKRERDELEHECQLLAASMPEKKPTDGASFYGALSSIGQAIGPILPDLMKLDMDRHAKKPDFFSRIRINVSGEEATIQVPYDWVLAGGLTDGVLLEINASPLDTLQRTIDKFEKAPRLVPLREEEPTEEPDVPEGKHIRIQCGDCLGYFEQQDGVLVPPSGRFSCKQCQKNREDDV